MITEADKTDFTVTNKRQMLQTPMPYKKKACPNIKHRHMQNKKQRHAKYNAINKRDKLDFTYL